MGIVVAIFMLFGLVLVSPYSLLTRSLQKKVVAGADWLAGGLLIAGLWNFFWYGLRNFETFWGAAALMSGVFMMAVAVIVLKEHGSAQLASNSAISMIYNVLKRLYWFWVIGLLLSFLLYATTLIQLNLGLPIIGY